MNSPVIEIDGYKVVDREAVRMLETNGTYLPNVKRVIFNLKTEEKVPVKDENGNTVTEPVIREDGKPMTDKSGCPIVRNVTEMRKLDVPILSTTVFWADGTTTTVKNSEHDPIGTEEIKLDNGSTVTVADRRAKEYAIYVATTKRTCGLPDKDGRISGTGMGRIVSDIIDSAYDQNYEDAKSKCERLMKKRAYETLKTAQEKSKSEKKTQKRYSYADCLQMFGSILERVAGSPEKTEKLVSAINDILDSDEK